MSDFHEEHAKLIARVSDLENIVANLKGLASDYRLSIARTARTEQFRERRRYALLQAAAILAQYDGDLLDAELSVTCAEALLEEIERREKAESQS